MKLYIDNDFEDIVDSKYEDNIISSQKIIEKCIKECLKYEGFVPESVELSVRYTNNEEIRKINAEYRKIDKATDVLSFPIFEKDELDNMKKENFLPFLTIGDVILSIEKIEEQSIEYNHSFERELLYLITHAMFHLLGYDHMVEDEKKIMREKEEYIMSKLKISR